MYKYDLKCLLALRNRYRALIKQDGRENIEDEKIDESKAFVELVESIDITSWLVGTHSFYSRVDYYKRFLFKRFILVSILRFHSK